MINKEEFQSFPAQGLRGERSLVPYGYRRVQLFYRSALLPLSQKLRALQQLIFLPIFLRHVQVIIYHQILQEKSCRLERLPFTLRDASGLFCIQIPSRAVLPTSLLCRETQKVTRSICPKIAKRGWRGLNDRSNPCFGGIFLF